MLTSKQRALLRSEANRMTPVFQVGKGGVDEDVLRAVDDCLEKRELIKIKALDSSPEPVREVADRIAAGVGAEVVQVIGSTMVLFRKNQKSQFGEMLR